MTQFQKLVAIYSESFETIIDENGEVLATQKQQDKGLALPLTGSRGVREKLRLRYMKLNGGKSPREEALTQVVRWAEADARDAGVEPQQVYIRAAQARDSDTVWVDLGTTPPKYARISPSGWAIESEPDDGVLFRRPAMLSALPLPVHQQEIPGGIQGQLSNFLNVEPLDLELLLATIASGFVYRIPHPIMAFDGPHGSAKTFASKIVTGLLDPAAGHQRVPSSPQDLLAGARHNYVYALDNVTFINEWLANDLCGLVTGFRSDSRRLYTNDELHSVTIKRIVVLSSTHYSGIARPDLVERTIFFATPPIPEGRRRAEEDLLRQFLPLVPRILGWLFSLVAAGLRGLKREDIRTISLPRMADFGRFLAAMDAEAGGHRFERYQEKLRHGVQDALRVDTVGQTMLQFIQNRLASGSHECEWAGTPTDLYKELSLVRIGISVYGAPQSDWPGSPGPLMSKINAIDTTLRANGIYIDRDRTGEARRVRIRWEPRPSDQWLAH